MVVSGKRSSGSYIDNAGGSTFVSYDIQDTALDLVSDVFTNILEIDSQKISRSTINMNNTGTDYSTFGEDTFATDDEDPSHIATSPSTGLRFVIMSNNNTIEVYDLSKTLINTFGGNGTTDGLFSTIMGIAANGKEVHICDSATVPRIQVFTEDGVFIRSYGGTVGQPQDIDFDPNGNSYVVSAISNDCVVFDSDGRLLFRFGSFSFPSGVTVDPAGKRIFICDTTDDNVSVFDIKGKFLFTFGSTGNGNGEFDKPFKAVIDAQNNITVSDFTNNRIQTFNQDGVFIFVTTAANAPQGMSIDSVGDINVAKVTSDLIGVFTPSNSASGNLNYRIFGSTSDNPEFTNPIDDPKWINLLSVRDIDENPGNSYSDLFELPILSEKKIYESFRNSWRLVIVQMAGDATRTGARAWHRGEST